MIWSPQRKNIWVNLIGLGVLLAALAAVYGEMNGSFGARYWASLVQAGSPEQRSAAAGALESLGPAGEAAVPAVLMVLRTPDNLVAPRCARALKKIDPQAAYEYAQETAARVERGEVALTPNVIDMFGSLGPVAWKAIPLLRAALHNRTEHVRGLIPALISAGDYDDDVLAAIVEDASDPQYSVKKWDAMLAFGQLGYRALDVRPELERLTSDVTPAISGQAKVVLSQITNLSPYAQSGLLGFPDARQDYQEYALTVLSKQGVHAAGAVRDVVTELRSRSDLIRFLATWTLTRIGEPARSALPQLRAAEHDPKGLVRDGAAEAIRVLEETP